MNKKNKEKQASVEEITKKELSIVETNDKIAKLEKDKARDKKIIAEYKEREKTSARAIVLFERKIKYVKETMIEDVLALCKQIDEKKAEFEQLCSNVRDKSLKENLLDFNDNLTLFNDELYGICNKLEANATLTKQDRAFISNKVVKEENAPKDANSRFDRLKQEFAQKIGASVMRKPGRPKKSEQSIIADLGLRKKVEKVVETDNQVGDKLNEIFYSAPKQNSVVSAIPQTSDSLFDFNEALNPNISLKDIMADLMNDKDDEDVKTYGEDSKMKEIEDAQKQSKIELLESGFIRNPIIKTKPTKNRTIDPIRKKPTFEKRFLSIQNIVKDSK